MPKSLQNLSAAVMAVAACALLAACSKPDYQTVDGGSGRFADWRGKWVFINYWAEWCKPCIEEMPQLNQFQRQYAANAVVFAVNFDNAEGAQLKQQIQKLQIGFPVLQQNPGAQLGYPRPNGLPTTFVIDPQGKLSTTLIGPQTVATLAAAMTPAQ